MRKLIINVALLAATGMLMSEFRAQCAPPLAVVASSALKSPGGFDLQADAPGTITFTGSDSADLFSKEVAESFQGVLDRDYVSRPDGKFPAGFVNASPASQPWYGTMWTRDAGTFMRELVFWGYYQHAGQVAQCAMNFVGTNSDGFIAFPRYFDPHDGRQSGSEMDGQASIIIAMVALWERLPSSDPFRARLYEFLHQQSSPVRGIDHFLESRPLVPGSGEFGGGKGHENYSVVQNNLCALALLSAAKMEDAAGSHADAKAWRKDAGILFHNMGKYLVNRRGSWIWGIDLKTLKPNRTDTDSAANSGGGGLNGVVCMSADVLGFNPSDWPWQGARINGGKTFDELYAFPLRKEEFEKYGMWPQMNFTHQGLLTSPSYGQGYALQDMLLLDKLDMAGHGLDFLAETTYKSPNVVFSLNQYHYERRSPYYFYERMYSPDAVGKIELTAGCGPLNLVNVSEPLKVARLIAGVDDTSLDRVQIIPRLPPSWSGYRMENWPICTSHGMVRADISFVRSNGALDFAIQVKQGGAIPKLAVRLPEKNEMVWKYQNNVKTFESTSSTL
ncbi:MAG TPA: hypothetical protein VGY56_01600 [Verrucomicrobiae bacterium]|nr:hypothetical protein [Verrucomicrobiae bacterium]